MRKKSNHDSRGKKSPNHASRKSIGNSLYSDTIGCASSVTFLFFIQIWRHLWSLTEQIHGNMESIC